MCVLPPSSIVLCLGLQILQLLWQTFSIWAHEAQCWHEVSVAFSDSQAIKPSVSSVCGLIASVSLGPAPPRCVLFGTAAWHSLGRSPWATEEC